MSFCIACGYPLKHGPTGNCPECGRPYSIAIAGSTANESREHMRICRLRRLKFTLKLCAVGIAVVVSLFYTLVYHECLQVRYHVHKAGGWDVVQIFGYDEEPGFSVTGVLLAVKDRPDEIVALDLNNETLREGEPIRIYGMKGTRLDRDDPRLLNDPRLNEEQRYYIRYFAVSLDVSDTGPLRHLFPHPIRNLDDLRLHYDEVYSVFSSFAADQSLKQTHP